jgi:hypothetical protein
MVRANLLSNKVVKKEKENSASFAVVRQKLQPQFVKLVNTGRH